MSEGPEKHPVDRFCRLCGTRLCSYNPGTQCFRHRELIPEYVSGNIKRERVTKKGLQKVSKDLQ